MKLKKICVAVASALAAGMATQASATTLEAFDANTVNVFTSGSTALDGSIRSYMRFVCVGGVDEFQVTVTQPVTPGIYANNNVLQSGYFCTLSSASSVVSNATLRGKKVFLRKSSGDSGEGVVVGGGALTINFLANPAVVSTTTANNVSNYTCAAGSSSAASGALGTIQQWSCTAGTTNTTTGPAGFADVEFSLLNGLITPKLTSAQLNNLNTAQIAANVWGIAVSKNLYTALQGAEGISASGTAADSEANMPSLDKELLNSLFTGINSDWSGLTSLTGTAIANPSSGDTGVYLARRPDSSGTQASITAMLLNFPCAGSATPMLADSTGGVCGTVTTGATSVTVNQGTGNLLSCLGTLNTAGKYGVGFASTSNRPVSTSGTVTTDAGWRYVKVNGVAPTLFNASTGRYDLVTEAVLSYQKTGPGLPSGNAKLLLDEMGVQLGQPNVLAAVNGGAATQNYAAAPWFAGVLTPGSNTNFSPTLPLTISGVSTNPVMAATRSFAGPNSCQPLQRFGASVPVTSN
jgi:hypothetical protein